MSEDEMMQEWEEELAMEGQTRDGFRVTDDGGAVWCVQKIREAQDECNRMVMWYAAQIEKAKARMNATVERMTTYLREYGEIVPAKETDTQRSYKFPGGKMIWKKEHREYRHDDAVVLEGLKRDGRTEYIKTVEKLDWAGLKKEISVTGELPEGVTMETVPESFEVKVEG